MPGHVYPFPYLLVSEVTAEVMEIFNTAHVLVRQGSCAAGYRHLHEALARCAAGLETEPPPDAECFRYSAYCTALARCCARYLPEGPPTEDRK